MRRVLPLIGLALVVSACAGSVSGSPPSDQAVAAAEKLTTGQRFHAARPVAVDYVKALARGDRSAAQADVGNSDYNQLSSLSTFETWFSLIPAKRLHVRAVPLEVHDRSSVGVRMVLTARLGPAPLTPWVKLGERVLLVQDQRAGWRVLADITGRSNVRVRRYGLSLMEQPHFLSAPHISVVYGPDDAQLAARTIFQSGGSVVKMLHSKYGGGAASRHPLVYLVAGLKQGEKLAGVSIGRKETPAGWQYKDFAYIDYPVWLGYDNVDQESTVAHELTHVASHTMLAGAPHSLLEGVAMYEEERYLNSLGYGRSFALIRSYYRSGFPSDKVWGLQSFDWGLTNGNAIDACYLDGEAMSAVIIEQHGGVPALARLARAYRSFHRNHYSPDQVRTAFQQALGVSFDTVVAEAHAYANRY